MTNLSNKGLARKLANRPNIFQNISRWWVNTSPETYFFLLRTYRKVQVLAESFKTQLNTPPPWNNPALNAIVEATTKYFYVEHSNSLVTFSVTSTAVKPVNSQYFVSLLQLTGLTDKQSLKKPDKRE